MQFKRKDNGIHIFIMQGIYMDNSKHIKYLKEALEVSKESRANGNTPFGAVLVDADGRLVLQQGNC